jgi:mannitol-1-/sugar-/sorbitol-6-phosphatase
MPHVVVDAAAVEEGKPSPAPYLRAAARLGAEPEDCLAIEDSPSGVQSALRAGMTVWGVNAAVGVEGAHRHFASLRESSPAHRGLRVGSSREQFLLTWCGTPH